MFALVLADIKGPLPLPGLPPFVLSSLALLLVSILLIAFRRRNRSNDVEQNPPTSDTLEQLINDYRQGGLSKEALFCRLSDLLADGLVRPTGSARRTTDEILSALTADAGLSSEGFRSAEYLLKLCDQVKFARYQPSEQELQQVFTAAAMLLKQNVRDTP